MKKYEKLIKELKTMIRHCQCEECNRAFYTLAVFILAREAKLINDHEILTKTIIETKNAEIKKMLDEIEKPLKAVQPVAKTFGRYDDLWNAQCKTLETIKRLRKDADKVGI